MPAFRTTFARLSGPLLLAVAALALIATGLLGVGRGASRPFSDLDQFVASGGFWLRGETPYDRGAWRARFEAEAGYDPIVPFPYPPQSAPFAVPAAWLGLSAARAIAAAVSLAAVALLALAAVRWVRDAEVPRPASTHPATPWVLAVLVVGNPFTSHLTWLAQPTLPVAALLAWSWLLARRRHEVAAGLLLGFATLKPQFLLLPLLWLLLEGRWRMLSVAAAVSLALAVPAFASIGVGPALRGWTTSLATYTQYDANQPGHSWVVGLPSLAAACGFPAPEPFVVLAAAVPLVVALFLARRRLCPDDHLGLLAGIQCALVYGHTNDVVFLVPLAAATWLHIADRRALWAPAALVVALLCVPQRLVHLAGVPLLEHWRTPLVLVALVGLLALSLQHRVAVSDSPPGTSCGRGPILRRGDGHSGLQ